MIEDIRVCQVVNAVGPTSIPADIATALSEYTDIDSSILAWSFAKPFENSHLLDVDCVESDGSFVDLRAYKRAKEKLKGVDIIHTHHNHAGVYAKLIGAQLGIPVIRTEQNTHDGYTRIGRFANGVTAPLATRITCISEAVFDSFSPWEKLLISKDTVDIIYNGVDFRRIERSSGGGWSLSEAADIGSGNVVVGNAAMLREQKAHDTLIRAISSLNRDHDVAVELVIAGDGSLREELDELARDLEIRDKIHFLGLLDRDEVYQLFAEVDVFCMPSRWEGFCVAVAEAMAVGNACVLSDIDVFRELYGDTALFHPVDDVEALTERIKSLSEDEQRRKRLSSRGRELIKEKYALEEIARQYEQLYREIV